MIRKASLTLTLLFDDQEVQTEFFQEATPSDLESLMDDEAIGVCTLTSITFVRTEDLRDELLALGNDGSFFDTNEAEPD